MADLNQSLADVASQVEDFIDKLLAVENAAEQRLHESMRYASLGGGKRLRPFLLMQSANLFGVNKRSALRTGAALELIHCYSLVHDDLPAMDDDDLRRGVRGEQRGWGAAAAPAGRALEWYHQVGGRSSTRAQPTTPSRLA